MSTDRYAVFGYPIAHSKSPLLQMAFAEQTQQNISYTAECIPEYLFRKSADKFFNEGGKGLNITVPFKQEAFNYAQVLTPRAQRAGAVNTLWIDDAGKIHGDTTDGVGLVNDIQQHLHWPLKNKHILILGAGGAVRGILEPLFLTQPASITIVNRTIEKAQSLADIFIDTFPINVCGYEALEGKTFDMIINGSSASLAGELPPLPAGLIDSEGYCYDMMYGKEFTPFLQWAQQQGVNNISDGLGMLVGQGAESFFIWRGVRVDIAPVIKMVREAL